MTSEEATLREQLDWARERIKQLEAIIWPKIDVPRAFNLTRNEEAYLRCMIMHPVATWGLILDQVYHCGEKREPEVTTIKVTICKLRQKLKRHGDATGDYVVISTVHSRGYMLTPQSKKMLSQMAATETRLARAGIAALSAPANV